MSTGGVSHLLQVFFGLFCSWSKWLKPPAFCAKSCKERTRGGTWRFPRVSRAKPGILWLSGGTTRVRWCGASYQSPSMHRAHGTGAVVEAVLAGVAGGASRRARVRGVQAARRHEHRDRDGKGRRADVDRHAAGERHAPCATRHAPRATRHAPRTAHHWPLAAAAAKARAPGGNPRRMRSHGACIGPHGATWGYQHGAALGWYEVGMGLLYSRFSVIPHMAGYLITPVLIFWT